jgi:phage minor structural protein
MLKVLNKQEELQAILENAKNVSVQEKLNGEYLFSFWLPRNDPKWQYIETENYIDCEGQLFIVRTTKEQRDSSGRLTANVQCEHVYTELIDEYQDQPLNFAGTTAMFALTQIMQNTRFTIGTVSDFGLNDLFDLGETNKLDCTEQVKDTWGGEFEWDNRQCNLLAQRGADNGVQFRYAKNLNSIERTADSKNLVTRLYGYGKDGLTIEGLDTSTWSQEDKDRLLTGVTVDDSGIITGKYIDSQYINNYPRPKNGKQEWNDVDDQKKLLEEMQKYMAVNEVPKVTYEVDIIELKKLTGYAHESFELGDTITIIDEPLNVNIKARVIEYEYYPYEPERSKVVLANYRENITDLLGEFQMSKAVVEQSKSAWDRARQFDQDGYLSTQWLLGAIATATNTINAGTNNSVEIDGNGITIYDPTDQLRLKRIRINNNAIALSVDGGAEYRTAMTSDGMVADLLTVGKILTSLVRIEGDSNFYWDAGGLYAIDPTDPNKRIRFNKDGIKFTINGGVDWSVAVGYAGLKIGGGTGDVTDIDNTKIKVSHTDGSYTQMDADGLKRFVAGEAKDYFYLNDTGLVDVLGTKSQLDSDVEEPLWTENVILESIPPITVTLPSAYRGKNFRVYVQMAFNWPNTEMITLYLTKQYDVRVSGGNVYSYTFDYDHKSIVCERRNINYEAGTFEIVAYLHTKYTRGGSDYSTDYYQVARGLNVFYQVLV